MSTHAAIIVKTKRGYRGCYLHFDGYPAHIAPILTSVFNTLERAEILVHIGPISSLHEDGRITPMDEPPHSVEGTTIEEVANAIAAADHIYLFGRSRWRHYQIPILMRNKQYRRDPKWVFKGHYL